LLLDARQGWCQVSLWQNCQRDLCCWIAETGDFTSTFFGGRTSDQL
jgi:hypothetical protein